MITAGPETDLRTAALGKGSWPALMGSRVMWSLLLLSSRNSDADAASAPSLIGDFGVSPEAAAAPESVVFSDF